MISEILFCYVLECEHEFVSFQSCYAEADPVRELNVSVVTHRKGLCFPSLAFARCVGHRNPTIPSKSNFTKFCALFLIGMNFVSVKLNKMFTSSKTDQLKIWSQLVSLRMLIQHFYHKFEVAYHYRLLSEIKVSYFAYLDLNRLY